MKGALSKGPEGALLQGQLGQAPEHPYLVGLPTFMPGQSAGHML